MKKKESEDSEKELEDAKKEFEDSEEELEDSEKELEGSEDSGMDFRYVLPFAVLLVLMAVPFSLNYISHQYAASRQPATPVVMKFHLVRDTAITVPSEAAQFEGFSASIHIDTQRLANLINGMSSSAIGGATVHGISGVVSPNITASISGNNFIIEEQRSQAQSYASDEETHWSWQVQPQSSGRQILKFHLNLLTHADGVNKTEVIEIAEANIVVKANLTGWVLRNWGWALAALLILPVVGWRLQRWFQFKSSQ